jgi:hypothetical protein
MLSLCYEGGGYGVLSNPEFDSGISQEASKYPVTQRRLEPGTSQKCLKVLQLHQLTQYSPYNFTIFHIISFGKR